MAEAEIFRKRVKIAELPSPVRRLRNLERKLGFRGSLWIKDDGVISKIYGGNKPRKLEFIFYEALEKKAKYLVSTGGIGTNHGLALSLLGNEFGFKTILFLYPQPVTEYVKKNLIRMVESGADVRIVSHPVHAVMRARLLSRRNEHYFVPPGGSSCQGNTGFYLAGEELKQGIKKEELPQPSWIFLPVGTGGTLAGLALSLSNSSLSTRIMGVCVVEKVVTNRGVLLYEIFSLKNFLRKNGINTANPLRVERTFSLTHRFLGKGYGHPTPEAVRAVELMKDEEGIELETTYTGKTLAALIEFAKEKGSGNLLFWNTHNAREPEIEGLDKRFNEVAEELGI